MSIFYIQRIMLNKINIKDFIILLVITVYIFLWEVDKIFNLKIDTRYVIFFLLFFILKDIFKDLREKNYKYIFYLLVINAFILIHYFLTANAEVKEIYSRLILLNYIFTLAFYYHETILRNKNNIVLIFLFIFFTSIVVNLFFLPMYNPEPHSCGGIKSFFWGLPEKYSLISAVIHYLSSYSLIYNENSHLAMTAIPVFLYGIYLLVHEPFKINFLIKILLIFFMFIILLKSSATLLAGFVVSSCAFILFDNRRSSWIFIFLLFFLSLFFVKIFFADKICLAKIVRVPNNYEQNYLYKDLGKLEDLIPRDRKSYERNRKNRESNPFWGTDRENMISVATNLWKKIRINEYALDFKIDEYDLSFKEQVDEIKIASLIAELKSLENTTENNDTIYNLKKKKLKDLQDNQYASIKSSFIKKLVQRKSPPIKVRQALKSPPIKVRQALKSPTILKDFDVILKNIKKKHNIRAGSTSASIFYHHLKISKESILEYPFGWGFNNYEKAAIYYNNNMNIKDKTVTFLNKKDGTNNFFKATVEFGIFGLLGYLMVFISFLSKKISIENKIFLFPFILTQSIRGAGYFNGGFLLILFIICIIQIKKIDNT